MIHDFSNQQGYFIIPEVSAYLEVKRKLVDRKQKEFDEAKAKGRAQALKEDNMAKLMDEWTKQYNPN